MGAAKQRRLKDAMKGIVQGTIAATMPDATAIVPSVDGQTVETPVVQQPSAEVSVTPTTQKDNGVQRFLSAAPVQDDKGNTVHIHCKQNFVAAVYFEVCKRMGVATRPLNNAAMSATKQIIAYVPEMPHKHSLRSDVDPRSATLLKNELSASGMNGYLRVLSHPAKAERIFSGSARNKPHTGVDAHAPQAIAYCDKYALHITGVQSTKPTE